MEEAKAKHIRARWDEAVGRAKKWTEALRQGLGHRAQ